MSSRFEEVKKVLSAPSSTPQVWKWRPPLVDEEAIYTGMESEEWEVALQVCGIAQGGQHQEAGQQSQGKGFVYAGRSKDTFGKTATTEVVSDKWQQCDMRCGRRVRKARQLRWKRPWEEQRLGRKGPGLPPQ